MTEAEKLDILFTAMLEIKWMAKERFRNGTIGLLKEAKDQTQLESILFVLKNLRYLSSSDVVDAGAGASTKIRSNWHLEPDSTLIVGVAEGDRTCGSEAYVRAIETSLPASWVESIKTQFKSAFGKRNGKKNLIIVDDFVGTGDKIIDRIGRLKNNPKTKDYQIYFCGFAGLQDGCARLSEELEGRIYISNLIPKCITGSSCDFEKKQLLLDAMLNLEKNIFNHQNDYNLGYKKSEAAFYLEGYNIPNNNFPILWWEKYANDSERATLFTRR